MLNDDINLTLAVFAFPFAHVDFLFHDDFEIYYGKEKPGVKNDKTEIRKKLVKYLKNKYYLSSYDEVYLLLDKWYLYPKVDERGEIEKQNVFDMIWKHLKCFSTSLISQRDGKMVYKYWENEGDNRFLGGFSKNNKIYLFHSMNRLFPMDILTIIYFVKNKKKLYELAGYYGNISVSDSLLDKILEKGVAENHLHCGVAVSFLSNWDNYMKPLTDSDIVRFRDLAKGTSGYDVINSRENIFLIMLANLLRMFLSMKLDFLKERREESEDLKEVKSLTDYFIRTFRDDLKEQIDYFCKSKDPIKSMEYHFFEKVDEIRRQFDKEIVNIKDLFTYEERKEIKYITDENFFLFKMVEFIESEQSKEKEAEVIKMIFLNYIRIKNHFYQLVVQQKTIHGLNFFQSEFYGKNSEFSKQVVKLKNRNTWMRAISEQLQDSNLRKLELRASIPNNEAKFKKEVNEFLRAYLKVLHQSYCRYHEKEKKYLPIKPFPKVGFVFHFIKKEQDYAYVEKVVKEESVKAYLQFTDLHQSYKNQLEILLSTRDKEQYFPMDKYLLGIDVASLESEVPTWVFSDIYEDARDSKSEPINKFGGRIHQSLGFTFHAGEDFRHILSGLRRIHEVIIHLKFHAGDRIGHGIALGIDSEKWAIQNKTIIIPRVEMLENYLWAYDLLSNYCDESSLINLDYMEKKINKLMEGIYGENVNVSINVLLKAYRSLFTRNLFEKEDSYFDEWNEKVNKFKKNKHEVHQDSSEFWQYTRQSKFFAHEMNEPIHIKIEEQEVEITRIIQNLVKKMVDEKGIIIEVNPSSNVVIADLDTLNENHVYGINNYGYQFDNLMVCINSDDPSVFNTNAANELGYIYFGMLERNCNRESALAWIDKLRENGMSASFMRRNENDEQILRELEEYVEKL